MFYIGILGSTLFAKLEGCVRGRVCHGIATTTATARRVIQHNQEILKTPAKRHGINQKTVARARSDQSGLL